MKPKNVLIMGAGGRDFHNFNVIFRDDPTYNVAAFTATQIPYIEKRTYPASLAGKLYPQDIPIFPEEKLPGLIKSLHIDEVVFSYSDVAHMDVMHKASEVLALGADFSLLGPDSTMLKSSVPVISVCAVRTGSGKSPVTRRLLEILRLLGRRPVAIRHPMAYCDLEKQRLQRFSTFEELDALACTVEEKEEYEPIVEMGFTVFAGVDYEAVLREAEKEADIIVWDGGNNDFPFIRPDLEVVVADALRPGHGMSYYPGETNLRRADVVIINKVGSATTEAVAWIKRNIKAVNPKARIVTAESPVRILMTTHKAPSLEGQRVVVVEDGPTITHGGMGYGAGVVAAREAGATVVSPVRYAVRTLKETLEKYGHIKDVLPAMGYSQEQLDDLAATINAVPCDALVFATPVNLMRLIKVNKPAYRVSYEIKEKGRTTIEAIVKGFLKNKGQNR